ncbi:four-helix bundle copper-binding protein [Dankookia rubra]|uniref:Four-helix bundle copper-binding protein n=1 Tax=Dankookia rubra TaxID=1442381 RepID=A0A4R5QH62_9PROT|nr:four-helix bundle copper-binding protein [Dankookia rubra]TDH62109.1 four-helix bundle copper-binding protein [Dankookia rubra]
MLQRRHLPVALAAVGTLPSAALAQGIGSPGPAMPGTGHGTMTPRDCVLVCVRSHAMCLETARYCTEQTSGHIAPGHVALLQDCAEMCQLTANSLLRRSSRHSVVCNACAELCETCAKDCEAFTGDEQMKRCAGVCRDCAESCRDMARSPV